ncbi:guanitoxin biosynthesis heme-dependent pre-guanitoxin N-hydroxylase GntA [Candidatus Uabimicrobium sp. HlEnr_7]|uniref:guanitoxin biosynthesis heme-dependent pre-guanitoxin N-hydroxylase GntA n=1 Tax=Candidatus Uabimicrobium helgolandensis TaxID=3095367 RepID=UPI003555F5EC
MNPFNEKVAHQYSCYGRFHQDKISFVEKGENASPQAEKAHDLFRSKVLNTETLYSCLGATSTFRKGDYRFSMYPKMASLESTKAFSRNLYQFIQDQNNMSSRLSTYVVCFEQPIPERELHFETLLWEQLQMLHNEDHGYHTWTQNFSSDPSNPNFAFSFSERGFFIVGLHSKSSRNSRQFEFPTIVFNAEYQFQHLFDTKQFDNFVRIIRQREIKLQGNINPNLPDTFCSESSRAKEYSGRAVPLDWKCPFSAKTLANTELRTDEEETNDS